MPRDAAAPPTARAAARADNACALGFTNGACGSGGAACANCSAPGSTCNTLVAPRVCHEPAEHVPGGLPGCPAGVTTPVTPSLQNLCDDVAELDALQAAACATAAPTARPASRRSRCSRRPTPRARRASRRSTSPFQQLTGIYRCAAPFVVERVQPAPPGCAIDCQRHELHAVPGGHRGPVPRPGQRQRRPVQSVRPADGLRRRRRSQPGSLCSPATYATTSARWLRAVGDHFCGNGP